MSEKRKTAAELMAELQDDPVFRRRTIEADRKRCLREQEFSRLLEPTVAKLQELGLRGESLHEIVQKFAPLSSDAIEVLLAALAELDDTRSMEAVIRALGAAKTPFDGRLLVVCFEQTEDEGLKWAILNTVALARVHSIDDWRLSIAGTPAGEALRKLGTEQ